MIRGCNTCGAFFEEKSDKETVDLLVLHQEKCSKNEPFIDDKTTKGYYEI